jgi:cytosine/adenosine deaminase-related metal-dependent hydrolase
MWRVMRSAIDVQKARGAYEPNLRPLRPGEAFYLATHGGACALGKATIIGTLDVGKEADLIIVDLDALLPYPKNPGVLAELSTEDVVALCIYRGGPQANLETYVRGRCVYQAPKLASRV